MSKLQEVDVPALALDALHPLIGDERLALLVAAAAEARHRLEGATVWNVNSTASGGGVAEMLQDLVMAALNEAGRKVDQAMQSNVSGMLGGLGGIL